MGNHEKGSALRKPSTVRAAHIREGEKGETKAEATRGTIRRDGTGHATLAPIIIIIDREAIETWPDSFASLRRGNRRQINRPETEKSVEHDQHHRRQPRKTHSHRRLSVASSIERTRAKRRHLADASPIKRRPPLAGVVRRRAPRPRD